MLYEKALAKERELAKLVLPEPKTLVTNNSKAGQSFRSLLEFCTHRTPTCSRHCYACYGHLSHTLCVKKSIATRRWIETYGTHQAAERLAIEILWNGTFRWMDRGDFDPLTVELANKLAILRPDVKFCAYSKNLPALKQLKGHSNLSLVLSCDKDNIGLLRKARGIKVSYLKTEVDEKVPKGIKVVHPLNKRRSLLGDKRDCTFAANKTVTCAACLRCYSK